MGKLLKNERTKLYKKPSSWILMGCIVALTLFILGIGKLAASLGGYSSSWTWQQDYESSYQSYKDSAETDPRAASEAAKYKYLLDNEIPPEDWRTDLVNEYYGDYYYRVLDAQQKLSDPSLSAGDQEMLNEVIAAAQKEMARLDKLLTAGDWREYVRMSLEQLENSTPQEMGFNSQQEMDVQKEIYGLYLELDFPPVSSSMNYLINSASPDAWKGKEMDSIHSNKLMLVRGETQQGQLLTSSTRKELQTAIDVSLKRLSTNTAPIESGSFMGLMDSSASSLDMVSLLLMVLAGGMIASEFSNGTVKLLLITPHKRSSIFWAKTVLLLEVILLTAGAMFVTSFALSGILTGFQGIGAMQVVSLFGSVVRIPCLLYTFIKYILFLLPVAAYTALALMLSAVTRKTAVAVAVSILLMFGSQMAISLLTMLAMAGYVIPGLKFLLFANTSLSAYFPVSSSMISFGGSTSATVDPTMTLGFSVVILVVYTVCFLWIARDSFCRRDIK